MRQVMYYMRAINKIRERIYTRNKHINYASKKH